jgi:hypothetical protein
VELGGMPEKLRSMSVELGGMPENPKTFEISLKTIFVVLRFKIRFN